MPRCCSGPTGASNPAPIEEAPDAERDGARVVAGTGAPWRWEETARQEPSSRPRALAAPPAGLRHSAIAGGGNSRPDQDSPRRAPSNAIASSSRHLESFALPIVAQSTPAAPRTWAAWLQEFVALVPRVLRQPARVARVLAEMAPLGAVGPVRLREVRDVLTPRLLTLTHEPRRRRQGQVFIGTPQSARGRTFSVVFVPGMAERIFPQRLREDALLLDAARGARPALPVTDTRADEERLQLRLAVGAATARLHLSYPAPRAGGVAAARAVVLRARRDARHHRRHSALRRRGGRRLGARRRPARLAGAAIRAAIDDMGTTSRCCCRCCARPWTARDEGRAHCSVERAAQAVGHRRWSRWQPRWSQADGLTRVQPLTAPALAAQRLTARPYSLTALQRYAACPYQFQLAAIYQLAPLDAPAPLQRLDPLTRGSLFHEIQTDFFRTLVKNGMLPLLPGHTAPARGQLEWAITAVTKKAYDDLAPAIDRVWRDEIAGLRRDLYLWFDDMVVKDAAQWLPGASSWPSACRSTVPGRRVHARSGHGGRPASGCAARSTSWSAGSPIARCVSPITRPGRTARHRPRSWKAAACCSPCSTPWPSRR
jgi:hypothetical protein